MAQEEEIDIEANEPGDESASSAVRALSTQEPPRLKSSMLPWIVGTPIILLIALSAVAYFDMLHSPTIITATLLLIAILFALIWLTSTSWDQDVQDTIFLVQEGRLELTALKDELTRYLQKVDSRASRHFDSISQNVTTYFNLIQIKNALEERLSIVSRLLTNATNTSLIASYRCLGQPLQLSSGPGSKQGKEIPIEDVEQIVMEFAQQLEMTLGELENEEQFEPTDGLLDDDESIR